jgi:tetratricopeptide (TPR) repeat protein
VWGESYEFRSSEASALPQRVAEGLADALPTSLSTADRRRLLRPPTSDADALADYTQARGFLDRRDVPGNLQRSVALFQSATRRDPTFALAQAGLGEAYWALYDVTRAREWTDKARDAIAEALRLDPDQPGVHYSLALIYHGTGRAEEALGQVRQALILQPGGDDAHRLLARLLADQGRSEEAVAEARRAIDLRPGYWGGYSALGSLYLQIGRLPEAAAAFRRVTELQPDNAWGFQQLGTALHMAGDTEGALSNYERALRLMPDPKAWGNVGAIHYAQGRLRLAARAFEESARLDPNSPPAQRNLGDTYRRLGQEAKARESYRRAVRLVEEALRVNPRDARALAMLAVYEAKLGRHAEARGHVQEALALGAGSAEVHYRAAVVYALGGRRGPAVEALEHALRNGYSLVLAQGDEDLAGLRTTEAYAALVARYAASPVAKG